MLTLADEPRLESLGVPTYEAPFLPPTAHRPLLPMAANPTPTNDSVLLARCEDLIGGCQALEVELGIKQNSAATMRAAVEAARLAQAEVGRGRAERGARRAELRRVDR